MEDLTRRNLLVIGAATACACCLAETSTLLADDDGDRRPNGPAPKSVAIGKLADFPKVGLYDAFRKQRVMVSKLEDRLVVMSAVCTHKGCLVKIDQAHADQFMCPCHKAEFSNQGTAIKGPAKTSLVRYALTTAADGTITADLTKSFGERQWDDAAAFIAIKA